MFLFVHVNMWNKNWRLLPLFQLGSIVPEILRQRVQKKSASGDRCDSAEVEKAEIFDRECRTDFFDLEERIH